MFVLRYIQNDGTQYYYYSLDSLCLRVDSKRPFGDLHISSRVVNITLDWSSKVVLTLIHNIIVSHLRIREFLDKNRLSRWPTSSKQTLDTGILNTLDNVKSKTEEVLEWLNKTETPLLRLSLIFDDLITTNGQNGLLHISLTAFVSIQPTGYSFTQRCQIT